MTRPFAAKKKIVQLTSLSYLQKSVKREKEYEDTFGEVPLELLVFHINFKLTGQIYDKFNEWKRLVL